MNGKLEVADEEPKVDPGIETVRIPAQRVRQPVGDMYIASVPCRLITRLSYSDVRRIQRENREVETYLGIQRPLDEKRVEELAQYVSYQDASFPGSVILSIHSDFAEFNEETNEIELRNFRIGENHPSIEMREIAKVLDGQHRLAGLEQFRGADFDVIVTVFIGADISDQAYIFATVNLEQRKVNKSLAYDLFALARSRSPQRTCHNIAVTFDRDKDCPFYKRIKRLGSATPGRDFETLTQATFVEGLMSHITTTAKTDRDILLRRKNLPLPSASDRQRLVMRKLFVEEKDLLIAENFNNFFIAVSNRWKSAWSERSPGYMLNRTNGFRALCRFFRPSYLRHSGSGDLVSVDQFASVFEGMTLDDADFNIENFPPGSSGEGLLFNRLVEEQKAAHDKLFA